MRRLPPRNAAAILALAVITTLLQPSAARAQDYSGKWMYEENGETAELELKHDRASGRLTGTLALFGFPAPITGKVIPAGLVIESVAGVPLSLSGGSMTGKLQRGELILTILDEQQTATTLAMKRQGAPPASAAGERAAPPGRAGPATRPPTTSPAGAGVREFAGDWLVASDDGTEEHRLSLVASGSTFEGTLVSMSRGYYSGRVSVDREFRLKGTLRDGRAAIRVWDPEAGAAAGVDGTAYRRGDYLVLRIGEHEQGFARPGVPLVRSAERSAEATALARAIAGRVYSVSSQASGRGGFVGGRMKLALCSDGSIAFDGSDVATTPGDFGGGVDLGGTFSRRGSWSVVLYAGAPAVKADWQGTGSTYSLTAYFDIRPASDGKSALVNGMRLPLTGRC